MDIVTRRRLFGAALPLALLWPTSIFAQAMSDDAAPAPHPVTMEVRYVADAIGVLAGGSDRGARALENLDVTTDGDLDRLIGWRGAKGHVHLLSNHGGAINTLAGTIQGVDNIEVADGRTKLYEAWVEQRLWQDRVSLLVGLSDLNVDFYQDDSAGLLIAPAFGIGSELAATGPNGPSIFPSTALTFRADVRVGGAGYVRAAIVNARAGVLGDAAGMDLGMHDGALLIAEAGMTANGKLAIGAWRYTRRQDDLFARDIADAPVHRIATGAYVLLDQRVSGGDDRGVDVFLRAGLSEGRTTPFVGGFQTGVLVRGAISGRPRSELSTGVFQGALSSAFRRNLATTGQHPDATETGFEITYRDTVASFLTIQPDLQYVRRAHLERGHRGVLIGGVRISMTFDRS
ncbi:MULTISPECIES: carbohydrate porin [unclassified Sphingomonas]|uniref:carbohydrate porin n=1 Tax=Sphingomonas sp. PvP015 TaxID=3156388 RepID=UPI0033980774